jgi:transcriptional regulator with XRE-family HTH domain
MIREWLIDLRKQAGMSQEDAAGKIGICRTALTKIERGNRPSVETAKRIAGFYGFGWAIFFDEKSDKSAHGGVM